MAKEKVINYECSLCGTKVDVSSLGEPNLQPIYCCGVEVRELETKKAVSKKKVAAKKKAVKKPVKKAVKPVAKKKAVKKK